MQRYIQISKLLLSLSLSLSLIIFEGLAVPPAGAAIISIDSLPLGRVIAINGQKFTKVRNDVGKGSQFIALAKVNFLPTNTQPTTNCPMNRIIGTMQTWNNCAGLATPLGANCTIIGCLVDERDGKPYEIRKFSDGKCWMVDNLAYGGTSDACASKTTFSGAGSATPTNIFGTGAYGDCRNNPGTNYGYLYNWQAAMQHASAYYNSTYTGPTTNVQGICPQGWHIPTGNTTGEYQALHTAVSSNVAFWQTSGSWKGVRSGYCDNAGGLVNQGSGGYYWSSTQNSTGSAYRLLFLASGANPALSSNKDYGFAVRCLKN